MATAQAAGYELSRACEGCLSPAELCSFVLVWRDGPCPDLSPASLPPHQVFSIVVFGSIVNEGYVNRADETQEHCIFNRNRNACNYGITVGVLAFLSCLLYLALDAYFPQISSVKDRKKAVLSDIGVSGELPGQLAIVPLSSTGKREEGVSATLQARSLLAGRSLSSLLFQEASFLFSSPFSSQPIWLMPCCCEA